MEAMSYHWWRNLVSRLMVCCLLCCPLNAQVYNISESLPCVTEQCFTLTHLATELSQNFDSSITLAITLSPEIHNLQLSLTVSNVVNFSIIGSSVENQETVIVCNGTGLRLHHVQNVLISGITFQGCGENIMKHVDHLTIENSIFKGTVNSRTALVVNQTTIASIYRSLFQNYTLGLTYTLDLSTSYYHDTRLSTPESVGGALIVSNSSLEISDSTFQGNSARIGSAMFAERNSMVNISDSTFLFNHGSLPGPGHTLFVVDDCSIGIHNSTFSHNSGQYGLFGVVNSGILVHFSTFSSNRALNNDGGIIAAYNSTLQITECMFTNNSAQVRGGVIHAIDTSIHISKSTFNNNIAGNLGGTLHLSCSHVEILDSDFTNSRARDGGVVYSRRTSMWIGKGSSFNSNRADSHGGVALVIGGSLVVNNSTFVNNTAEENGGVMDLSSRCNATITQSILDKSVAEKGVAIHAHDGTLNMIDVTLSSNKARMSGGILEVTDLLLTVYRCSFIRNTANSGAIVQVFYISANISTSHFSENSAQNGVLETAHCTVELHNLTVIKNAALFAGMYIFQSIAHFTGQTVIENNIGSLYAFDSHVHFVGNTTIKNCSEPMNETLFKGGGLTTYRSVVFLNGTTLLTQNQAKCGGGFLALESFVNVYGQTTIANNKALNIGGGAYVYQSDVTVQDSNCIFTSNEAQHNGGGIYAISSLITTSSGHKTTHLSFVNNTASQGGGTYLEANSKLYVLKREPEIEKPRTKVSFIENQGRKGGAIYVADETNSRACATNTECFFQVLSLHMEPSLHLNTKNIFFSQNFASGSGNNIFGGLLDRCLPSTFAEIRQLEDNNSYNGLSYVERTTNVTLDSIASSPVRVCFCVNGLPDCNYTPQTKTVKKGEIFNVEIVAIDQIGRPLRTNVTTSFRSNGSGLSLGQTSQFVHESCINLSLSIRSPQTMEKLYLHPYGPCNSNQYSTAVIPIKFGPCTCPIGFDSINTKDNCKCSCASVLSSRITDCNDVNQSFIKTDTSWISYTNETEPNGYIVYSNCPFTYCLPPSSSPRIDLNIVDGADVQCNHNRRGTLCGACKESYSLSLGSTRCLECPPYWPAFLVIIILFVILIGVAFVVAILFLNLTVAVGTINAIVFYVNIIDLQRSVFFPLQDTTYQAIIIAWLNLDFRIDLCFYKGMDAYIKTWLRLVFPSYIILLVILVIVLCKYSSRFANFIGKRDPVATLATLILLSYTRLLDLLVEGLGFIILHLPDGSVRVLWFLDANVNYFLSKHAPLFIVTLIILLICVVFTLLLLLWQWIVKCSHKLQALSFIHSPKFASFIETYHIPFNAYARYWTGLLLLVRVILYLITIFNFNRNPHVQLTATIITIGALLMIKGLYLKPLYRKWLLDAMETIVYSNIIALAAFTAYTLESNGNHAAVTIVSTSITVVMLIAVIVYHVYVYTCIGRLLRKLDIYNQLVSKLKLHKQKKTSVANSDLTESQFTPRLADMSKYRNSILEAIEAPTDGDYLQLQYLQSVAEKEQSVNHDAGNDSSTPVPPTFTTVQLSNDDTKTAY